MRSWFWVGCGLVVACASPPPPTAPQPLAAPPPPPAVLPSSGTGGGGADPPAKLRAQVGLTPSATASLNVYFGNLHSHTSYSDGSGTPEDAFTTARGANLDFLAVTEHNHRWADGSGDRKDGVLIAKDKSLYAGQSTSLVETAKRMTGDGFVALYGQEWSSISKGNHMNVFEIEEVIDTNDVPNGDVPKLLQWLQARESGGVTLMQLNHPALFDDAAVEYGRSHYHSVHDWVAALDDRVQLIEIINGPAMARSGPVEPAEVMESDYLTYLAFGFHVGPVGDQDNHYLTWGLTTHARTGVWASGLTRSGVLDGLRQRRTFASEDANLGAALWVGGTLMGAEAPCPSANQLPVQLWVGDADEPNVHYTATVFVGRIGERAEVAEQLDVVPASGPQEIASIPRLAGGGYVFVRLRQLAEHHPDRLWTAPVWFAPCVQAAGVDRPRG